MKAFYLIAPAAEYADCQRNLINPLSSVNNERLRATAQRYGVTPDLGMVGVILQ